MKKYFYSAVVAMMALFTVSCSQNEAPEEAPSAPAATASVSFNVKAPSDNPITRAADSNVKRYAIAIDGVDLGNGVGASIIQASGTFDVPNLTTGNTYTVTFWADYDDATLQTAWQETGDYATYDITWLTYIKQNKGTHATMAYCGSRTITVGEQTGAYNITLKRAVAQVNLKQANPASKKSADGNSDWITVTYKKYTAYNAQTGAVVSGDADAATGYSYEQTADLAANADLGSFYAWANTAGITDNIAITYYATATEGTVNVATVSNVPLCANYKTNITGNFNPHTISSTRFVVTTDDAWATPDNNASF